MLIALNIFMVLFFTLVVYFHVILVESFYDDYVFDKEWERREKEWNEKFGEKKIEQQREELEKNDEILKRIDNNLKNSEKILDANYPDVIKSIDWHLRIEKIRKDIAKACDNKLV